MLAVLRFSFFICAVRGSCLLSIDGGLPLPFLDVSFNFCCRLRSVVVVGTVATAVGTPKMPVLGNITACTYPDSFFVPI